jgi:hypothetical protein
VRTVEEFLPPINQHRGHVLIGEEFFLIVPEDDEDVRRHLFQDLRQGGDALLAGVIPHLPLGRRNFSCERWACLGEQFVIAHVSTVCIQKLRIALIALPMQRPKIRRCA